MSIQNIEFEVLLHGKASIVKLLGGKEPNVKSLKISTSNVLLYQDWSFKTRNVNNSSKRKMFTVTNSYFDDILNTLRSKGINFTPSCVVKMPDHSFSFITICDFKIHHDYMILNFVENFSCNSKLSISNETELYLNMSSLPYNLLDIHGSLSKRQIPWGSDVNYNIKTNINERKLEQSPLSFILSSNANIVIKGGIIRVLLPGDTNLTAYEQWSINYENTKTNRSTNCISISDFTNKVHKHNEEDETNKFTPTTTFYLGNHNQPIVGKIEDFTIKDMNMISRSSHNNKFGKFITAHSEMSNSSSLSNDYIEIKINTLNLNNVNKLPDGIYDSINFYMNIDDTARSPLVTVHQLRKYLDDPDDDHVPSNFLHDGEILVIPDANGECLIDLFDSTKATEYISYGGIKIINYGDPYKKQDGNFEASYGATYKNIDILENLEEKNKGNIHMIENIFEKANIDTNINFKTSIYIPKDIRFVNRGHIETVKSNDNPTPTTLGIQLSALPKNTHLTSYIMCHNKAIFRNEGFIQFVKTEIRPASYEFSYISDVLNWGHIRFGNIVNSTFRGSSDIGMVSGIKHLTNSASFDNGGNKNISGIAGAGEILFGEIISTGPYSRTNGIFHCFSNQGNIFADLIRTTNNLTDDRFTSRRFNPLKTSFGSQDANNHSDYSLTYYGNSNINSSNFNVDDATQECCAIRHLGAINPHMGNFTDSLFKPNLFVLLENAVLYVHKMVTPRAGYDMGYDESSKNWKQGLSQEIFDENNINVIHKISGNAGNVLINNIINETPYSNLNSEFVACGVVNLFQIYDTDNLPTTTIHYVGNFGYGGIKACMGIKNVLLNHASIRIDVVENNSPTFYLSLLKSNFPDVGTNGHYDNIRDIFIEGPSVATGVFNCVQNGFCCLNPTGSENEAEENQKDLIYGYLPPYPPQFYYKDGSPEQKVNKTVVYLNYQKPDYIDGSDYDNWYENLSDLQRSNLTYNEFSERPYGYLNQGHIGIYAVNNFAGPRCVAEGINTYGGWSYNTDFFSPSSLGLVNITSDMFNFVKNNVNSSIIWSFPTAMNTSPENNPLLDDGFGYTGDPSSQINTGWRPDGSNEETTNSYSPSQLYYAYKPSGATGKNGRPYDGQSSDIIFFPINWGIITIDSVHSGHYINEDGGHYINEDGGYAYGIKKLISSIGRIQILNVSSTNEQKAPDVETYNQTIVNTRTTADLSFAFDEDLEDMDCPNNFSSIDIVESVNEIECFNDMDLIVYSNYTSGIDPTNSVNPTVNSKTNSMINYRFPYEVIPKTSIIEEDVNDFNVETQQFEIRKQFKPLFNPYIDPSDGTFEKNFTTKKTKNKLLDRLKSEGAAFAVYRTIDYGCSAPGCKFLCEFTRPFYQSNEMRDFVRGIPSGNVEPWKPTIPFGLSLNKSFYQGGSVDHGVGGCSVRPINYRTLRNVTLEQDRDDVYRNSPWANLPYDPCVNCVVYLMPGRSVYNSVDKSVAGYDQAITPLFIGDLAAPGGGDSRNTYGWFGYMTSDIPSDYKETNWVSAPGNGGHSLITWEDPYKNGWGNTTNFWVISGNYTGPSWSGSGNANHYANNEYASTKALGPVRGWLIHAGKAAGGPTNAGFMTLGNNIDDQSGWLTFHTVDPTRYFGGIEQFFSYWNALSNTSYNGLYKGSLQDGDDPILYKMHAYNGSEYTGEYDDFNHSYFSYEARLESGGVGYARYNAYYADWGNNLDKNPYVPNIYNNELDSYLLSQSLVKTGNNSVEPPPASEDRGLYHSTNNYQWGWKSGLPFTKLAGQFSDYFRQPYAEGFKNHYWYEGAPAFRGIDPSPYDAYDYDNFNYAGSKGTYSWMWNVIQSDGAVLPPKYEWTFPGNPSVKLNKNYVNDLTPYNLLPSQWPGSTNLTTLLRHYRLAEAAGSDIGYAGPYRKYYPYRNYDNGESCYPEEFLMYNYSASCPPGFNPQFIQGQQLYFTPENNDDEPKSYTYDITKKGGWYSLEATEKQPYVGSGDSLETYNSILVADYAWNLHNVKGKRNRTERNADCSFKDSTREFVDAYYPNLCVFNDESGKFTDELLEPETSSCVTKDINAKCFNPQGEFNLVDPLKGTDLLFGGAIGIDTFGSGNTGFCSISSGNTPIFKWEDLDNVTDFKYNTIMPPKPNEKYIPRSLYNIKNMYIIPKYNSVLQDDECGGKYYTRNSYYGFSYERNNYKSDLSYGRYYIALGSYRQLSNIMHTASSVDAQTIINNKRTYDKNLQQYNLYAHRLQADFVKEQTKVYRERAAIGGKIFNWIMLVVGSIPIFNGLFLKLAGTLGAYGAGAVAGVIALAPIGGAAAGAINQRGSPPESLEHDQEASSISKRK